MECWWTERGDVIRYLTGFKSGTGKKKKVGQTGFPAAPAVAVKDQPGFFFGLQGADFRGKMGVGFWTWQPWGFPEWTCCMGNWLAHLRGSGVPRRDMGWRYPRDGGEWSGPQHGLGLIFRRKNVLRFLFQMSLQGGPPPEGWIPVLQSVSGWFGGMVSGPRSGLETEMVSGVDLPCQAQQALFSPHGEKEHSG